MICEYYEKSGRKLNHGHFSLPTKSIFKARVEAQIITGWEVKLDASNFVILGEGNKRLVVSKQS